MLPVAFRAKPAFPFRKQALLPSAIVAALSLHRCGTTGSPHSLLARARLLLVADDERGIVLAFAEARHNPINQLWGPSDLAMRRSTLLYLHPCQLPTAPHRNPSVQARTMVSLGVPYAFLPLMPICTRGTTTAPRCSHHGAHGAFRAPQLQSQQCLTRDRMPRHTVLITAALFW